MSRLIRIVGRLPAADDLTGLRFIERHNQINMETPLSILRPPIPCLGRKFNFKGCLYQRALTRVQVVTPVRAVRARCIQQSGHFLAVVIRRLYKAARAAVVVVAVSVGQVLTPKEVRTAANGCGPRLHRNRRRLRCHNGGVRFGRCRHGGCWFLRERFHRLAGHHTARAADGQGQHSQFGPQPAETLRAVPLLQPERGSQQRQRGQTKQQALC